MSETEFSPADRSDIRPLPIRENWTVPSSLKEKRAYVEKFENLLASISNSWITPDDIFGLQLGFDEALIDAIKYGNKVNIANEEADLSKTVEVEIEIDEEKLVVSIWDNNNPEPFDPSTAFDSVADESLRAKATTGRGRALMHAFYPDGIDWEFLNPGNKVTMTKLRRSSS